MNRFLPLFLLFSLSINFTFGQNSNDTANYPYWIGMMQDRNVNFYQTQRAFNLYWENRPIQKASGWKSFKRWEWYASKIIDSAGNFPAYEMQFQDMLDRIEQDNKYWDIVQPGLGAGTAACKTQGDWKSIGPTLLPTNNTGQMNGMGRVNAIGLHPTDTNTLFIGSAAGGIWKTTDGGQTWAVNTDSLPTLGVSAIAIDPNSPSTMYFGSGDRDAGDAVGYGVFKSTNSGASWSISNTGMGNRTVGRLIIDPKNTSTLLAACNGGIYRSTNSGSTWTQTYSGGFFKDILFKPNNSNVVYATKDGLLYRSVNNGQTWSALTTGLPTTGVSRAVIEVSARNPSLVYVWIANGSVHKGIYLSRDSGNTFRTQSTTPNLHDYTTNGSGTAGQAWYDMDMVVDPSSEAIMYCGGVNIFKSTDTGKTWTIAGYWVNQIHADQHELAASPITNRIFAGNDGGFYASRNKGASWTPLKSGLGISQIYKMDAARTTRDILISGLQDNGTVNYNAGWYTTYGGDGMDCAIDQGDPRYSYGELYYGSIFRVFNLNAQATIANNGYIAAGSDTINESGGWVTPFTLREGNSSTMYIGYKNIWRSSNVKAGTVQWKKISNNLGGTNSVDFTELESNIANSDILYASRSNGTLYRSDNVNGTTPTWTAVTQPVAGVVNAIETDPKNQNVVYIGVGARVYRSTNKGSSWTQVNSTFSNNVATILLDTSNPKKGIYVGTYGGGVWYTDTTLSTWRYFTKGLPNTVSVTDLEMYYEPNKQCNCNVLYGATYNRGNWYTTIYHDGTKKPVALLNTYDTVVCRSNTIKLTDKSCYNPTRFKWAFTPSVNFVNGSDTMTQSPTISFPSSGKYSFKFMAENCIGTDTTTGYIIAGDTAKSACIPTTTNNVSGLGIFYVELAGMSRTSSGRNPEGAYVNLSCSKIVKLKKGKKYLLKVTTGSTYTEQVKAFIDFNNNGTLNDAGEVVFQPAANIGNHADTITIPTTVVTDKVLRLRIRSDYVSTGTNPCSNLSYGQTEDYAVYIESDAVVPKFVSNQSVICQGNKVLYTDSTKGNGILYSWNFGSGAVPSTAVGKGPHLVKYAGTGYKKVTLNVDGIIYMKDSVVKVNPAPDLNIAFTKGDSSVCRYSSFTMKANDANSSGAAYQWRLNGISITDSIFPVYRINTAAYTDSGRYSVIATIGSCKDTAYQNVRVRVLPVSKFTINDSTQCKTGNSFVFSNGSSIPSGSYINKWFYGNSISDTGYSKTYSYPAYGTFTVKLRSTSNYGCVDSVTHKVYVYENAVPDFSINSATQCYKYNSFTYNNATTLNTGSFGSQWSFGDGSFSTSANPSAKHYTSTTGAFKVKLVVTTNNLCKDSIEKNVTVNPSPVGGFAINDTDQCLKGNSFVFTNQGNISGGVFSTQWNFGDGNSSVVSSPAYTYANANTYTVRQVLTSNLSCKDTVSKAVRVYTMPKANFTINDSTQCLKGNSVVFNETGTIAQGSYTRQWNFGNGFSSGNKSETIVYARDSNYSVTLKLISNNGCRDSLSKPVFVYPQATVAFAINKPTQCFTGNAFNFTNNSTIKSGTYTSFWNFGDLSTSTLSNPATKTYNAFSDSFKVTLNTNSNQACKDTLSHWVKLLPSPKAAFIVNDSEQCLNENAFGFTNGTTTNKGAYNSEWFFGDNTGSNINSPNHKYLLYGSFAVKLRVTSSGICKDSVSKILLVNESPVARFSVNDTDQCYNENNFVFTDLSTISSGKLKGVFYYGDNVSDSLPPGGHSYPGKSSFTARQIVWSSKNCTDTAVLLVNVLESPMADFTINDTAQCSKWNQFVLTNTSSSTLPYIVNWKADNGAIAGSNANASHKFSADGYHNFTLIVTNNANCTDTVTQPVNVKATPAVTLRGDSGVCVGDRLNLDVIPNSYTVDWYYRSQLHANSSTYSEQADVPGNYPLELYITASNACKDTLRRLVKYYALPVPVIDLQSVLNATGNSLEVDANDATGIPVLSRNWSFSEGTTGTSQHILLILTDTITLKTVLTITDTNGCTGVATDVRFLSLPNDYFIPNTITPNGDKINDEFKLSGFINFKSYTMKVYNRWGEMLFDSQDPNQGWNGTYMGEKVQNGTYIYIIEFEDWSGKKMEKKGYVMVMW